MNESKVNKSGRGNGRGRLIYVVDDEPLLLELAAVVLEPLGYTVQTFRTPAAALEAFTVADREPALLITDYAMDAMTGMDLAAACRGIQPRQKILLVSGTVGPDIFQNALAKPNRFLAKPFQADQLIEAVHSMLAD